ncbi:hypothetical protein PR202_gb12563 [Eleusine coracana subsp. coracana]|uniref:Uncharacterized protein n=1 Tax=Eleusine coracana subsp. coracana TaxID=191504 RepID=A0AAV5EPU7_ELECO|nr:hypothetical protein PR202_gb12563 [Eleusine coracana subsp. coracana]
MEEKDKKENERWASLQMNMDLLFAKVESIDKTPHQLVVQMELTALAVNESNQDQQVLAKKVETTGNEKMAGASDPGGARVTGWDLLLEAGS